MNDSTNGLNESGTKKSLWRCIIEYGVANETDRRNQHRFTGLTLIWALVYLGAAWLVKFAALQGPVLWLVPSSERIHPPRRPHRQRRHQEERTGRQLPQSRHGLEAGGDAYVGH